MDIDDYVIDILQQMHEKIKQGIRLTKKDQAILFGLAHNYGIRKSNIIIVFSNLCKVIPIDWINESKNYSYDLQSAEWYSCDDGMVALRKLHTYIPLNTNEQKMLIKLEKDIQHCPKTTSEFIVFRGLNIYSNANMWKSGDVDHIQTPISGTFSTDLIFDYSHKNPYSWVARIIIPPNKHVMYIGDLDQVVFPSGSQFLVISPLRSKTLYLHDSNRYKHVSISVLLLL